MPEPPVPEPPVPEPPVPEEYTGLHRKPDDPESGPGLDTQPSAEAHPSDPIATLREPEPEPEPALHIAVEDFHHLKRWTFVLVLIAVWIVAAPIGLGLYYWWYHALDKTPAVFVVLLYLVACTIAALLLAMVQRRPVISGIAMGLLSAPFWSVAAAGVLHGVYFCEHARRCLVGVLPY
ncbi:MAG: hypothetical protein JO152_04470 [Mycobacteriaceae bacterium]|nr:hypothetical protein [Mycobacteriaceae bacterium]